MKCLVVDDDPLTCDLVKSYLKQIGVIDYGLKVNDGSTALHLLAAEQFDAVFLDLQLPGIDGITLLKALPGSPPPGRARGKSSMKRGTEHQFHKSGTSSTETTNIAIKHHNSPSIR